jgi:AcrR family transcriptional regulator
MGSVRHFFATQHELLTFALEEVVTRVTARIRAGGPTRERLVQQGRAPEAALALLEEVLPLDDERLTEATVWAAFTAPPLWDPAMAGLRRAADDALGQLCQDCVRGLAALGHVHPDRDQEVESARIHALVDGLTLHRLLDPDRTSAHHVRSVVRLHLADLAAAPTADARNR